MIISIKYRKEEYVEFQIDEQDLHFVIGQKCRAAYRSGKFYLYNMDKNQYVHRMIMGCPKGMWIDHIDGDPRNNCRNNLRIVTPYQNASNQSKTVSKTSSEFKGVCYYAKLNKFRAYINHQGKRIDLGYHVTAEDAARAYNAKAIELNGEYARLNKLD